jgi:hypothetical protein
MKKNKLYILISTIIFLISLATVFSQCKQPEIKPVEEVKELAKEELSYDQKRLLSMFGYPDEFIVVFDEENNNLRVEIWIYEAMESSFTFEGGKYDSRDRVITPNLSSDSYDIKPQDFVYAMSPDEVCYLMGENGEEIIDPTTGYKVLIFGEGIIACTFNLDDALINVARLRKVITTEG